MKSETTRRNFLTGAAAAAGAFTIVAPQSVRGSQANSKIAVGLVGCGGRGSYDASIANADPRATVMALCDRFADQYDKAETTIKSQNTRKYSDFEKLLGAADIDAVFIVTPPFEHPRMLEAGVQARKHI
jgi:predicted dehydrogenase